MTSGSGGWLQHNVGRPESRRLRLTRNWRSSCWSWLALRPALRSGVSRLWRATRRGLPLSVFASLKAASMIRRWRPSSSRFDRSSRRSTRPLANVDDRQLTKALHRNPRSDRRRDFTKRLRPRGVRTGHHYGGAGVSLLANHLLERNPAEVRNAEATGGTLRAAVVEDEMLLAALTAHEPAHVLDETQWRHVEASEHLQRLDRDREGGGLRRADDGDSCERQHLGQRQGNVSGSRREIDDEVV